MPDLIRPLVCQAWYPASGSGPFFTLQTKLKKKHQNKETHLSANASQILKSDLLLCLNIAGARVAEV